MEFSFPSDLSDDFNLLIISVKKSFTQSLGELEKPVETLACSSCSHSISRSPKLPIVSL